MEFVDGATLKDLLLRDDVELPWDKRMGFALDVSRGLLHLHSKEIVHGGVSSANVVIDRKGTAKLTGFSISKFIPFLHNSVSLQDVATEMTAWMAPELFLRNAVCTKMSDVYCLGLLFLQIVSRKKIFESQSMGEFIQERSQAMGDYIPVDCPKILKFLITFCCDPLPGNRPDVWTVYHLLPHAVSEQGISTCQKIEGADSVESLLQGTQIYLAEGSFGSVYRGQWNGRDVAVKVLDRVRTDQDRDDFMREVESLKKLKNPNIVSIYGYCYEPDKKEPFFCIVMKYMPKGSLEKLLDSQEKLPWGLRIRIAKDIARGLMYLHLNDIVHRDIKSQNILLDADCKACFCDFGLSREKRGTMNSSAATSNQFVGTFQWMAPELSEERAVYKKESDIYSLGMTLWELASRKTPFSVFIPYAVPYNVKNGERNVIPEDCPPGFADIIRKCWDDNPKERPDIKVVMQDLMSIGDEDLKDDGVLGKCTLSSSSV